MAVQLPPRIDVKQARASDFGLIQGDHGNLWFERRSATLFVTFDNLATLDHPYPRMPWMHDRVALLGHSILGVQSFRKDWFRQETTPQQIAKLAETGFFDDFDRVVFMGASMGAFAAFNFAPFVPAASVLAFSPQSTMNRKTAPFERRFQYSVKRSDWDSMPFLDAAAAVPYVRDAVILYDPLEMEDKMHAARLRGKNVHQIPVLGTSHQAIRIVVKCDALPEMMEEYASTHRVGVETFKRLRRRKALRPWRRKIIENLVKRDHPKLLKRACDTMLAEKDYLFARAALADLQKSHPELF